METKREIPKSNYLKLFIILAISILVVLYFTSWYIVSENNNDAYISNVITELKEADVESYIVDNPNAIIYFSNHNDESNDLEKELEKYITESQLAENIVFIDNRKLESKDFYYNFTNKYFSQDLLNKNVTFAKVPNIVVFENGKIIDIIVKENEQITIYDIKLILSKYEVQLDA